MHHGIYEISPFYPGGVGHGPRDQFRPITSLQMENWFFHLCADSLFNFLRFSPFIKWFTVILFGKVWVDRCSKPQFLNQYNVCLILYFVILHAHNPFLYLRAIVYAFQSISSLCSTTADLNFQNNLLVLLFKYLKWSAGPSGPRRFKGQNATWSLPTCVNRDSIPRHL